MTTNELIKRCHEMATVEKLESFAIVKDFYTDEQIGIILKIFGGYAYQVVTETEHSIRFKASKDTWRVHGISQ